MVKSTLDGARIRTVEVLLISGRSRGERTWGTEKLRLNIAYVMQIVLSIIDPAFAKSHGFT
jgi:hypothetical protein